MKKKDLPKKLAVFPLSNFIIFPNTTVPLNIFEPRYIDMVNDSMKSNKLLGMIQPKISKGNEGSSLISLGPKLPVALVFKGVPVPGFDSGLTTTVFEKDFENKYFLSSEFES